MDAKHLKDLLQQVARGQMAVEDAAGRLAHLPYEDMRFAHIDHHRSLRRGFPEVIYGEGKSTDQIIAILTRMASQESVILVTRLAGDKAAVICDRFPGGTYDEASRMLVWGKAPGGQAVRGKILVVSAGTSDIPVAREALLTAQAMGNPAEAIFDVGVAGLHRLLAHREALAEASVLVVVAGMEGALPSVVGGLVDRPVIAVPTSVGYGANLGGLAALFSMLNSCSSNVAVVNIDNGFGAGYMASIINRP